MSTRRQNEKKFDSWEELPNGGRRYSRSVSGRLGWNAKYIKEVDAHEQIVFFRQEIYNEYGVLVEIHKIYPEDTGHHKV